MSHKNNNMDRCQIVNWWSDGRRCNQWAKMGLFLFLWRGER